MANPLVIGGLLLGAAVVFLVANEGEASAKSGGPAPLPPAPPGPAPASSLPGAQSIPPPEVVSRILVALQSMDPALMRAEADRLDREGWKAQAADLRAAATNIENARKSLPPGAPSPTFPPPNINLPSVVPPPNAVTIDPERELAGKTALMLSLHKGKARGTEDKKLVAQFQVQEVQRKHYAGAIDGLYGPKTAMALATDWGFVPPPPLYWPKNATEAAAAKAQWAAKMLAFQKSDPPRADEWAKAAKV